MIVDLFAGPGGWDEGLRSLGHQALGIEWDEAACATARAAGHERLQADIAGLDPRLVGPVEGLIASPPCQSFSKAGKGLGVADKPQVIDCAHELTGGWDSRVIRAELCQDARSLLTVEPLRWALALRPRWLAFEQVPAVLELWSTFAPLLEAHGYHVDTGVLSAEQYGVPQTRKRAYLVASLDGPVSLPAPTHQKYKKGEPQQHGDTVLPWVSMADALGWGLTSQPAQTVPATSSSGGPRPLDGGSGARRMLAQAQAEGKWTAKALTTNNRRANATVRASDEPAPTMTAGHDHGNRVWLHDGSPWTTPVEIAEVGVLQGFRPDYPWQGTRTKQFQQVGNAVCPPVGAAVLAAAMGRA